MSTFKKLLQYLWCCISPNGHVISDEDEDRLSTEKKVFICERCKTSVHIWMDEWRSKDDEYYWIQEVDLKALSTEMSHKCCRCNNQIKNDWQNICNDCHKRAGCCQGFKD